MWSEINSVFDCMPLAAVVDGRIFCTHGGIPEERKYEQLGFREAVNSVPCPLPDPENQSPLAWDLMWADPGLVTLFHATWADYKTERLGTYDSYDMILNLSCDMNLCAFRLS